MSIEMKSVLEKQEDISEYIHTIRGVQVMLDYDLAKLYGYTVKTLNQQVKRNMERFPEDFMFELTYTEMQQLSRSQIVTSIQIEGKKGGRTHSIKAFSEQGIYMPATILRGDTAVQQSIYIMRAFKELRHFIIENQQLLNISTLVDIQRRLLKYEDATKNMATKEDIKLLKNDIQDIMDNFIVDDKVKEFVFLNGQQFEADEVYINIYKSAKNSIFVVDNYISIKTLSHLKYKRKDVNVIIFSDNLSNKDKLRKYEFEDFNQEYPTVKIKSNGICHDRFIILDYGTDKEVIYHCGASSKDAGKKVCAIQTMPIGVVDRKFVDELLSHNEVILA